MNTDTNKDIDELELIWRNVCWTGKHELTDEIVLMRWLIFNRCR